MGSRFKVEGDIILAYTSWGEFVTVTLSDGSVLDEVIVCPDPSDPENVTLLEKFNGDVVRVNTVDIEGITRD